MPAPARCSIHPSMSTVGGPVRRFHCSTSRTGKMALALLVLALALIVPRPLEAQNTGFTRLADGFDFPVGKPDGEGYYKARGFRSNHHLGEDWNGLGGGDSDLGDPVYSVAHGVVVFARDFRKGWGNVVIVRHAYMDNGRISYVDSLYGHLDRITIREGQQVRRGDQVGTIGNNRGMYNAHLHFEMRKNLNIGMQRSSFQKDFSNYYDPTRFIAARRTLSGGGRTTQVALNTFSKDGAPPSAGRAPTRSSSRSSSGRQGFTIDRYGDVSLN